MPHEASVAGGVMGMTSASVGAIFVGQNWQNHTAQILGATFEYKFE
jgi:hypothetical protein